VLAAHQDEINGQVHGHLELDWGDDKVVLKLSHVRKRPVVPLQSRS
jgi:hypothetical protein